MKKTFAVLSALVCVITCFTLFAGCTADGKSQFKQAFCNHKWQQQRYVEATCQNQYNVITYSCSKCHKEKTEKVAISMEELALLHDWQVRTSRGEDCQHHDWEIKECSICKLRQDEPLQTYGPHIDNGNGKCLICGGNSDK